MTADVPGIFKWLEQTPVGSSVRESLWLFPAIETLHLVGMAVLVTMIGAFDLRLLGISMRGIRVSELTRRLFPWAWAAFVIQVITGGLLFSSEATKMVVNPAFQIKLILIGFGGIHAAVFRWITCRDMPEWDANSTTPVRAKVAGGISILLWLGVIGSASFDLESAEDGHSTAHRLAFLSRGKLVANIQE